MALFCSTNDSRSRGRLALRWCLFVGLALVSGLDSLQAQSPASASKPLTPNYWKQRVFFIPYRVNQQDSSVGQLAKVRLLVSRSGAGDWQTLQEAEPHVQGFTFHAPADGDYWFAVRTINQQGNVVPGGIVRAQLHIVVDTEKPTLTLVGTLDASGAVVLRYEAQDRYLRPESLSLEANMDGGGWKEIPLGEHDVNQPNRLVGRVPWKVPNGAKAVKFRAQISDRSGQNIQSTTEVVLTGPLLGLPTRDWPANSRQQTLSVPNVAFSAEAPPARNVYTVPRRTGPANQTWPPTRATTQLIGDRFVGNRRSSSDGQSPSLRVQASENARSEPYGMLRLPAPDAERDDADRPARSDNDGWTQAVQRPQGQSEVRMVNSHTFDVEYELESIGPWGVSKVELWGTPDGGRSWRSFGIDPDNRSPLRVTVPDAGTYGFRILVDGANGVGAMPPRSGATPDLVVTVDLQMPAVELLAVELGRGNQADHLLIRWSADDSNLEPRPIGLFYSTHSNGPWSTIAAGLENTGHYTWRLERHVPEQFYLRLEARDTAGNLATFQSASPVALDRPQPTGRLRSVRPVPGGASAPRGSFYPGS